MSDDDGMIIRHCHSNNLPSSEQAVKTKPIPNVFLSFFLSFFFFGGGGGGGDRF